MPELDPNEAIQNTEVNWDDPSNPWKTNFENYRVEADRRATQLSTYESLLEDLRSPDIERQRAAAAELKVELVEDEPVYTDPNEALAAQLEQARQDTAALRAMYEADKASAQEQRIKETVEARLTGMGLDEEDKDWVTARAVALGAAEDGLPNLKAAYEQLIARDEAVVRKWAERKPSSRIQPGSTGTETKNVAEMTDAERIDWAVSRLGEN